MRRFLPLLFAVLPYGCGAPPAAFDPLAEAAASKNLVRNREAVIPPQCYTKTDGVSNPCWTCHTAANGWNRMDDTALQEEYAFSETGKFNRWDNLFEDRRAAIAAIGDAQALAYIRRDNYTPLREALKDRADYLGWKPDLDYRQGFDEDGFARDGSGWRAFRYKPFPGTFWPTNGSTDDVLIRLPREFRTDAAGRPSNEVYKLNLAILEAAMTVGDRVSDARLARRVEPVDEAPAEADLDGDGRVGGRIEAIRGLPAHYAGRGFGKTRDLRYPVWRWTYPVGTEFLHTVRYIDPDAPNLLSARVKEVRYAFKRAELKPEFLARAYKEEAIEKAIFALPHFYGTPQVGLMNDFGWQLQGFIEDAQGRLRLQTHEEHFFCMGCHSTVGVTVDQSFAFPRKVPGAAGWGWQSLDGIADVPQAGQREPEILTYLRRVGGGDEFRGNGEMLARFFPGGVLDEAEVRRAAPGGDRDIAHLIAPSRERALALNKAYMALVRDNDFRFGRDAVAAPATRVHRRIENGETGLKERGKVYDDGRLWLEWPAP